MGDGVDEPAFHSVEFFEVGNVLHGYRRAHIRDRGVLRAEDSPVVEVDFVVSQRLVFASLQQVADIGVGDGLGK